jgi:hypothetical protein
MGDEEPDEGRSVHSATSKGSMARTARRSEWGETAIFSSDGEGSDDDAPGGARCADAPGEGVG